MKKTFFLSVISLLSACTMGCSNPKSEQEHSIEILEKSAQEGNTQAQTAVGLMYLTGQVVDQDTEKGRQWLEKAADQGDITAQYNLGLIYLEGIGVEKDLKQAADWLKRAAKKGHLEAKACLDAM